MSRTNSATSDAVRVVRDAFLVDILPLAEPPPEVEARHSARAASIVTLLERHVAEVPVVTGVLPHRDAADGTHVTHRR